MKKIFAIIALCISSLSAHAAVVGAGDLAWEQFHEDGDKIEKYNLNSVTTYSRSYNAEVWLYIKFKRPVYGNATMNENGEKVEIKYVFQKLVFDCRNSSYVQKEFLVFRWSDEAKVGHLMTDQEYSIQGGSPMDKLRGIVCHSVRMR
jgi:hypothetical protein